MPSQSAIQGDRGRLRTIVITRMVYDRRTNAYIERRMNDDQLTKKEDVRCLKRYLAREVFNLLPMNRLTA